MKSKNGFRTFYLLYVALLFLFLIYVALFSRKIMLEYEYSSPDRYTLHLAEEGTKKKSLLAEYMETNCFSPESYSGAFGDPSERRSRFQRVLSQAELTVEPVNGASDGLHPRFTVLADGKPFLVITLSEEGTETKLGIMPITKWKIDAAVLRRENPETALPLNGMGTVDYTVTFPEQFTLKLDGVSLASFVRDETKKGVSRNGILEGSLGEDETFRCIAPFTEVPENLTVTISNLTFEPEFSCENNGGEAVDFINRNGKVVFDSSYGETAEGRKMYEDSGVDALAIGTLWSKFMTNDVGGKAKGLYAVREGCLLVTGSDLYTRATAWAGNVDIIFVSHHVIDSWTNGEVSGFIRYSEDLFSCDVYVEKNMTLTTGAKRTDTFHNRLFFFRNRDEANGPLGWRLVDMIAL